MALQPHQVILMWQRRPLYWHHKIQITCLTHVESYHQLYRHMYKKVYNTKLETSVTYHSTVPNNPLQQDLLNIVTTIKKKKHTFGKQDNNKMHKNHQDVDSHNMTSVANPTGQNPKWFTPLALVTLFKLYLLTQTDLISSPSPVLQVMLNMQKINTWFSRLWTLIQSNVSTLQFLFLFSVSDTYLISISFVLLFILFLGLATSNPTLFTLNVTKCIWIKIVSF